MPNDQPEHEGSSDGITWEALEVLEALETLVRSFRRLDRNIGHLDPVPDNIVTMVQHYSTLEIGQLDLSAFRQLAFDVREIDEHIGDTLRFTMETKAQISVFQERIGKISSEIVVLVKSIEEAPAPSLRVAIASAAELARQQLNNGLEAPHQIAHVQGAITERTSHDGDDSDPDRSLVTPKDDSGSEDRRPHDGRSVFVVHGRNLKAKKAMFDFLRSLDLLPIEWESAVSMTGKAAPFVGDIVEAAASNPCAVVVLLTGDDEARVREQFRTIDEGERLLPQPRLNVVYEAGMAFGLHPNKTILVELGPTTDFSDISGRHVVRIGANEHSARNALRTRLGLCGCKVGDVGDDWLSTGEFLPALQEAKVEPSKSNPSLVEPQSNIAAASTTTIVQQQLHETSDDTSGWNGIVPFFRLTSQDEGFSSSDSICLVIRNFGDTPAVDVQLAYEDAILTSKGEEISASSPFTRTHRLLMPNDEIVLPIEPEADFSLDWILGDIRSTYRIEVTARNAATGAVAKSHHALDLVSVFPFR